MWMEPRDRREGTARATFKDGFVEEAIFETEDDRIFKGLWSIVMAEASFSATSIVTSVILKRLAHATRYGACTSWRRTQENCHTAKQ